jgi:hypothetical protein
MWPSSWLRPLRGALRSARPNRTSVRPRRTNALPLFEALEDRTVPSFLPAVNYSVGQLPLAIVTADFNGDGKLDLAVANYQDNMVSVLLGKRDGTFQAAHAYATGAGPRSIAVGDFNKDGNLDLVTANAGDATISVLLGNGDGSFGQANNFGLPQVNGLTQTPLSVAVGDFNKDGKLDLAPTGQTSYTTTYYGYYGTYYNTVYQGYVNVLLGDGSGNFAASDTQQLNSTSPLSVQVGDLNADGKPDVAIANADLTSVAVLLGNGDGTLGTEADYSAAANPVSVALGDVNGDGTPDLVTANGYYDSVSVMLGNGDGTFQAAKSSPVGANVQSLALTDLSNDGKLDVVTAAYSSNSANALLGKGDGTFSPPIAAAVGTGPAGVAIGDFNGDGRPDAALTNIGSANVSVLLNDGAWPPPNAPTLSINSVSVTEGNTGTTNANFTVTLSAASSQTITVQYATADGTATVAGNDYLATSGTLTFAPNQTTATIPVPVVGDRIAEPNETFTVTLSQPTNAFLSLTNSTGTGTILDDEPRISINNVSHNEGTKGTTAFVFTVSLSAAYDAPVTVQYATADGSATVADNDYIATSGTLTFAAGQTTATITVSVVGDRKVEPNEYFYVNLSKSSSDALISNPTGIGTILNDDHHGGNGKGNHARTHHGQNADSLLIGMLVDDNHPGGKHK